MYGQNPRVGITDLPISKDLMETLATEAELNTVVAYPGMVQVEEDHITRDVRQGEESEEEETYSFMDELVMASEDNADIFGEEAGTVGEEEGRDDTTDGVDVDNGENYAAPAVSDVGVESESLNMVSCPHTLFCNLHAGTEYII